MLTQFKIFLMGSMNRLGMCRNLNKVGCFFVILYILFIVIVDLFFYSLRCQFSPPISTIGSLIVILLQIISAMLFSGTLEYYQLTAINLRICKEEEKEHLKRAIAGLFILWLFATSLGFEAFLRSDAFTKGRGASSIGDQCLQKFLN